MTVLRRFFQYLRGPAAPSAIPFAVKCSAGHELRGLRQRRHQVRRCEACGESVFILPRGPFAEPKHDGALQPGHSPWRGPLFAACLTLVIVAGGVTALLLALARRSEKPADLDAHLTAGEQALSEGKLRRAAEEFDAARQAAKSQPDRLSPTELRDLDQRCKETSLLADLLSESLGEILLRASRSQADEWDAQFQKRYRGSGQANAVVFDAEAHRDGAGKYHLDWELRAGIEPARLEISDLTVLHGLPLDEPRRMLFGARLGSIAREQNGVWVVRFETDSGVLLTDPRVLAACYPGRLDEATLKVLARQREWVKGH